MLKKIYFGLATICGFLSIGQISYAADSSAWLQQLACGNSLKVVRNALKLDKTIVIGTPNYFQIRKNSAEVLYYASSPDEFSKGTLLAGTTEDGLIEVFKMLRAGPNLALTKAFKECIEAFPKAKARLERLMTIDSPGRSAEPEAIK